MKKMVGIALVAGFALFVSAGSSFAHHSFGGVFDAKKVVNIKGVIVSFEMFNPHSLMFVDTKSQNGEVEHWALEGPAPIQLARMGVDKAAFSAGNAIEACGYATKDDVEALKTFTPPEPISLSLKANAGKPVTGRLVSAELLTLPSGQKIVWSNYGQRKCLDPQ